MGCDIHLYLEYKIANAAWQADRHHILDEDGVLHEADVAYREYELFAALAGVRGRGPKSKGLPEDVTDKVRSESDRWGEDGHSHSYTDLSVFKKVLKNMDILGTEDTEPGSFYSEINYRAANNNPSFWGYANIFAHCQKQVEKFKVDLEIEKLLLGEDINTEVQCRLVYWFDN